MTIQLHPIPNSPALWIDEYRILVIADLHIGIENELIDRGVHIQSQTELIKQHLYKICDRYNPSDIIILGDVKHTIPSTPFHEKKELYDLIHGLQSYGDIHIIPGNHDGSIKNIVPPSINIHPSQGIIKHNIGFIHGHRWPDPRLLTCSHLLIGHSHPTIMLSDRLGYQSYESCWLKTTLLPTKTMEKYPNYNKDISVLIIPAFNKLCGGTAVNKDGLVGPLKSIIDIDNAQVFLLDGSDLGKVKHIK
jgi:putative SbcD/Mre11-related phosphoesterase